MSVFVSVLSIASSLAAETRRHKEFAAWIASQDQAILGHGFAGFDIADMPWKAETIAADEDFMLSAVRLAMTKTGWERLDYTPPDELIIRRLDHFCLMLQEFRLEHTRAIEEGSIGGNDPVIATCPIHEIYTSQYGCPICHDH
ncbi:hypothetical protein [Microvirga aerophila]|uniref:Uncharacterized protein n=1 Tax=Microvirga aerophila TaxID=670291 RepID=A0A512BN80_9HYPH|nr:hypothetical protein [Microvirga aerophila]GEO13414.1 hypothetical protein MAE02_11100 [Microvirga aerophila]